MGNKRQAEASRNADKIDVFVEVRSALSSGCIDCGSKDLRVLEFDHVRGSKVDSIANMISNGTIKHLVLDEIAKCEVRCKNCHAIKTYECLGGSWRDLPL